MKNIIILMISLTFLGCHEKLEVISNSHKDIDKNINLLFSNEKIIYNNYINKRETVISEWQIDNNSKNSSKLEKLKNNLKNDSWFIVSDNEVFLTLCFGQNNKLNMIKPNSHIMFDHNGNKYEFDNLNKIIISYRFYIYGIDDCIVANN